MKLSVPEIMEIIESGSREWYGIRADRRTDLEAGDRLGNSRQWWQDYQWDGDPDSDPEHPYCEEMGCWEDGELDGTCAVSLGEWPGEAEIRKALRKVEAYRYGEGVRIYLICGDSCEAGNDPGEIIIRAAEVAAVID